MRKEVAAGSAPTMTLRKIAMADSGTLLALWTETGDDVSSLRQRWVPGVERWKPAELLC